MSENFVSLVVHFKENKSAQEIYDAFEPLEMEGYKDSDSAFKEIGIKTNFSRANTTLESGEIFDSMISLNFLFSPGKTFTPAFLKNLPENNLIVVDAFNNGSFSKKSSVYIHGEKAKKKDIVNYLDEMTPELAFVLCLRVKPRSLNKYFKLIGDPNKKILGHPLFWHVAPFAESNPSAKKILQSADMNFVDNSGNNILHHLAYKQATYAEEYIGPNAVDEVLAIGCETNLKNNNGDTPLLIACKHGGRYDRTVVSLIDNGADVNILDNDGYQPIHHAWYHIGFNYAKDRLISAGADLNAQSPAGSPLWIANKYDRDWARELLHEKSLQLIPGKDSYTTDHLSNLITAFEHQDYTTAEIEIKNVDVSNDLSVELFNMACKFKDSEILRITKEHSKLTPKAPFKFNDEYIFNHLSILPSDNRYCGDSRDMYLELLVNCEGSAIQDAIEDYTFSVNLKNIICYDFNKSVSVFKMIKNKGVDLSLINKLWFIFMGNHEDRPHPNLEEVILSLQDLGLNMYECRHALARMDTEEGFIEKLFHQGPPPPPMKYG